MPGVDAGDRGRGNAQTQIAADCVGSTVPVITEWIVCVMDRSGGGVRTVRSR